jgi:diamine N-acetyltransferase
MIISRTPTTADAEALAELGASSFVDAFGTLYSASDLSSFLEQAYSVDAVTADLANPNRLFRVAEEEGEMVGYCKLGLDYSFDFDLGGRKAMDLKQLYLRGSTTGKGVGSTFMAWAIDEARVRHFDAVVLSVYSGNIAGQRFYRRHGFTKWSDTYFMVGAQRDEEYLYGLWLTDGGG